MSIAGRTRPTRRTMKIRITIKRGGELRAVLEAVNGRASTHTVSGYSDLALFVDAAERQLSALPKREHIGAVASCVPSGPLSRSYKYDAVSTQVEITRFASGWFLTGAGRATVQPCAKEVVRLTVSAGQAAAIREHAVSQFVVAEPTAVGRYLEPAFWSKDDQSRIGDIADLLADLPDPILSVIETAFLTFEVSFPWETEQDEPDLLSNTRKMIMATKVARCL